MKTNLKILVKDFEDAVRNDSISFIYGTESDKRDASKERKNAWLNLMKEIEKFEELIKTIEI